uniref:Wuschel-like homeobox 13D n=1 Tax=Selaginella kraussiana TaxID=81964 RepID=A0A0P0M0E9_9TRAC|nr:wuschel-like homeobox 13D [Selaginella kraussiana]
MIPMETGTTSSSSSDVNPQLIDPDSSLERPAYHPHYGVVITPYQLQLLRDQIASYATICLKLIDMHKALVNGYHGSTNGNTEVNHGRVPYNNMSDDQMSELEREGEHDQGRVISRKKNLVSGSGNGNLTKAGTTRHRWTPTQTQLKILEDLFGVHGMNNTPNKRRVSEITADLAKHGPISESNVSNWFQNRKARYRRLLRS